MHLDVEALAAHGSAPSFGGWDLAALIAVLVLGAVYLIGLWRMRGLLARSRTLAWRAAATLGGGGFLLIALAPPVVRRADLEFSAHMGQHELMMIVAPVLLVLGRPLPVLLRALPMRARAALTRILRHGRSRAAWRTLTAPLTAFALQALVLWTWHLGQAFELALAHEAWHALQHAMFFASAGLFWWSLIHGRFGRHGYGLGVLFVFATALHSGVLGALLMLSRTPWYATHAVRAAARGIDPAADQQLAGLLMWVPAGVLFTILGLALFAAWLAQSARAGALGEKR